MAHQVLERRGREAPNANGFFVQNDHGGTVAGPFDSRFAAWAEADRLDAAASTELVALDMIEREPGYEHYTIEVVS